MTRPDLTELERRSEHMKRAVAMGDVDAFTSLKASEVAQLLAYIRDLERVAAAAKEHNSDVCPEDITLVRALAALAAKQAAPDRPGCDHTWIAVKYRGVATGELCTKCHASQDSPEKTRRSPS